MRIEAPWIVAGLFVLVFAIAAVRQYLIYRQKKTLRATGKFAELIFNEGVRLASQRLDRHEPDEKPFSGFRIWQINGDNMPQILGRSIFVSSGQCRMELEHVVSHQFSKGGPVMIKKEKQTLEFPVKVTQQYRVRFDRRKKTFDIS